MPSHRAEEDTDVDPHVEPLREPHIWLDPVEVNSADGMAERGNQPPHIAHRFVELELDSHDAVVLLRHVESPGRPVEHLVHPGVLGELSFPRLEIDHSAPLVAQGFLTNDLGPIPSHELFVEP